MPNWCECNLFIEGPREQVERFLEQAKGTEEGSELTLDFNKFIPMPDELAKTTNGSFGRIGYDAWYGDCSRILDYPWVKEAGVMTKEELQEFLKAKDPHYEEEANRYRDNIERFGFPTWYEWALENWGTKWNASHAEVEPRSYGALIRFATAWSPPTPVVVKASEMFPHLSLRLKYYEGGGGFKGVFACRAGKILEDRSAHYHGSRGG